MTTTTATAPSLGDRYAQWTVALLAVLALLAGWMLKAGVENRSVGFEADGVSAQAPAGWLRMAGGETELLHAANPASDGFGTTYVIDTVPVPANATGGDVASLLSLSRGQALTGFRVLDQFEVTVDGRAAYRMSFAYVETHPDATHDELPSVVQGIDFIFLDGSRAVVVTYMADESAYEADYGRFRRFLSSVKF